MKKTTIAAWTVVLVLIILSVVAFYVARERGITAAATSRVGPEAQPHPSFLYGRVTTLPGAAYEGRLRFGDGEEAFWGDYFNGVKKENPWAAHVPPDRLPTVKRAVEVFGVTIRRTDGPANLGRPLMARFGDIARIEAHGTDARVTLKSGAAWDVNRFDASDFDDGVRVWDAKRGEVNVDSKLVRTIELFSPPRSGTAPWRLHGTVRTPQGDFTGFIQWDRESSLGWDELTGRTAGDEISIRFDRIQSIARESAESARVTLKDGTEFVLSDSRDVGRGNRGIYVDDLRYGRVLISWDAFERVDVSPDGSGPAGSGPAYDDFPPGRPLTGTVTTRDGRRLTGRLVYDLDESEVTETLDAPSGGVNYIIPFGLIARLVPAGSDEVNARRASITLHSGQTLQLEPAGDLGEANGGMLIFVDGSERPEYVQWSEIEQLELDHPPAMYPPIPAQ